jgi:PAS domain S-box-containing protein
MAAERVAGLPGPTERGVRMLMHSLPAPAATLSHEGIILECNGPCARMVQREHLEGIAFDSLLAADERHGFSSMLEEVNAGKPVAREMVLLAADGTERHVQLSLSRLSHRRATIFLLAANVTERTHAEQRARAALKKAEARLVEKEALLRELHHRSKNHLQMLCDLLLLQEEAQSDTRLREALTEAYGRVMAIARLHELLHLSLEGGKVQINEYLNQIVTALARLSNKATFTLDAPEPLYLEMDRAIYTGLIVNELITNALKHAFTERPKGEVTIGLRVRSGRVELEVRDDGKGLPAAFNLERVPTLGLRIAALLCRRLDGTTRAESCAGARFTVSFPVSPDA